MVYFLVGLKLGFFLATYSDHFFQACVDLLTRFFCSKEKLVDFLVGLKPVFFQLNFLGLKMVETSTKGGLLSVKIANVKCIFLTDPLES